MLRSGSPSRLHLLSRPPWSRKRALLLPQLDARQTVVSSNTTRDHDEKKGVAREEGVEGCFCCSWHAVRLGDRVMRAVCCNYIHRQSTGQSRDETAAIQAVGSWTGDPLKQSEAAVVAGPDVADNGLPMRFVQADVEARRWEERSLVFEA